MLMVERDDVEAVALAQVPQAQPEGRAGFDDGCPVHGTRHVDQELDRLPHRRRLRIEQIWHDRQREDTGSRALPMRRYRGERTGSRMPHSKDDVAIEPNLRLGEGHSNPLALARDMDRM